MQGKSLASKPAKKTSRTRKTARIRLIKFPSSAKVGRPLARSNIWVM